MEAEVIDIRPETVEVVCSHLRLKRKIDQLKELKKRPYVHCILSIPHVAALQEQHNRLDTPIDAKSERALTSVSDQMLELLDDEEPPADHISDALASKLINVTTVRRHELELLGPASIALPDLPLALWSFQWNPQWPAQWKELVHRYKSLARREYADLDREVEAREMLARASMPDGYQEFTLADPWFGLRAAIDALLMQHRRMERAGYPECYDELKRSKQCVKGVSGLLRSLKNGLRFDSREFAVTVLNLSVLFGDRWRELDKMQSAHRSKPKQGKRRHR